MRGLDRYDSIVIGAGHNGLVCAAYLAQAGQRVLVLEASGKPGGFAAAREFHPGFKVSVAHTVQHFSKTVASDLGIQDFDGDNAGSVLPVVGFGPDGTNVVVGTDSVQGVSDDDSNAYRAYRALMRRFAAALRPSWARTMPRIGNNTIGELMAFAQVGINLRRLGKNDMREFLRIASLPARDLVDEYFDSAVLKSILCWDGLTGSRMAPRSPNGAVLKLLYRMAGDDRGSHRYPPGGCDRLIDSICKAAAAAGAEIVCDARVIDILTDESADGVTAVGVQLTDGSKIEGRHIISAIDPRQTFIDLLGVRNLDIGFTNRINRLRCDGMVAKLHLALDGLPKFAGLSKPDGRLILAPDMDAIEFAYDDAKYGECPTNPVMEVVLPSMYDESVAPAGKHVLSAHVMFVPYQHKVGWNDILRNQICDRSIDIIARYAPGIREQIIHREFLTPADLESRYHVTGGHWHHTEFAMDQMLMMRPTYEAAQYSTPIPGLYLCGAGSHPGGDITGLPGRNAAQEILR